MTLPAILHVRDLRLVLPGWTTYRIAAFMRRNGLAIEDPDGRTYTTDARLRERMPDAHSAIAAKWDEVHRDGVSLEDFSDLDDE